MPRCCLPDLLLDLDKLPLDIFQTDLLFANSGADPLVPKPRIVAVSGGFKPMGFARAPYAGATHIRRVVAEAFTTVGLPKFNPHSFRKTIVALAMEKRLNPEEFKAWSQNLGHESIATTMSAYMPVSRSRQRELIKRK